MKPFPALLGALLLSGAAHAQHAHGTHGAPGITMQEMNDTDLKALKPLTGRAFDIQFAQRMTRHHRMAVDMAQYAFKNAQDARIRKNAQAVMNVQGHEIEQLARWLQTWKASVPRAEQTSFMNIQSSPERWYASQMIPHHQGAIDMAKLALTRSKDRGVLNMARAILNTQQTEINQYQTWLKTLK